MTESDEEWDRMIQGLRRGDSQTVRDVCRRYGALLERVADKQLAAGLRRRVEPEDVVQSACRTFFRRVQGGEFQLPDSEALWRLLCAIVVAKVREQTRFHMRGKRAVQREVAADLEPRDTSTANIVLASPGPTPAEAAEWADQLQQLLQGLTEEERQIVDLKLQQYTHEEVAQHLGRSERTVRRLLKRIEARLLQTLAM